MSEGLDSVEVGRKLAEHRERQAEDPPESRHDRILTILEAAILAVVAILAAYSGYASAKWGTESSLKLAQASSSRTEASREALEADSHRNFDATTFNAWLGAYSAGNSAGMEVAVRRFRPDFRVAFDAWMATDPASNPNSPPGPTYMVEYRLPEMTKAVALDELGDEYYKAGAAAGATSDGYVRTTVYLATVLFLIGIATHFKVKSARIGLVAFASILLVYDVGLLVTAPVPPG